MAEEELDPLEALELDERLKQIQAEGQKALVLGFLNTKDGRAFCYTMLELTGLNAKIFSTDHAQMAYFEGRREVGLDLQEILFTHGANLYSLMQTEATERMHYQTEQAKLREK